MKKTIVTVILLLLSQFAFAKNNDEFRATWVITWNLIDSDNSTAMNKALDRTIIENHKTANMNAMLWQVRQGGTAYYQSSYEPWGYYAGYNNPGYDPLAYAIQEAHKRGMEVHAWFNTFDASSMHAGAPSREHPDWVCRDRNGDPMTSHRSISPGLAEVRAYLVKVAMEIVRKYDIDGIHLDYVRWNEYTNSAQSQKFGKLVSERRLLDGMITDKQIKELQVNSGGRYLYDVNHPYSAGVPAGFETWEDWWRWSVTEFVRTLHDSIQAVKPWVRLSTAVLGKYNWSGWQAYGTVYQDAALWFNKGYVDQLTPMQYHWLTPDGFYGMLVGNCPECWGSYIQPGIQAGRLYTVGPGSYLLSDYGVWNRHPAIVEKVRTVPWVDGFQFFSYGSWRDHRYWNEARSLFFQNKTKIRATKLIVDTSPDSPAIDLAEIDSLTYEISVTPPSSISINQRFAVYRSEDDSLDVNKDTIVDIHFGKDPYSVQDHFSGLQDFNGKYRYFATTLDRYWNESSVSNAELTNSIPSFPPIVVSTKPADGDSIPITESIVITFTKTMDTAAFNQAIDFSPSVTVSQFIWSKDHKTVTIVPAGRLGFGTAYTVTIKPGAADINGTSIDGNGDGVGGDAFVFHFRTFLRDIYPPQIVSSYPDRAVYMSSFDVDAPIEILFDELLDPATVNDSTVLLYQSGSQLVSRDFQLTTFKNQSVLSMKPFKPMAPQTVYTAYLTPGITDTAGNHMAGHFLVNFRTSVEHYYDVHLIDDFSTSGYWEQPGYSGSTVGTIPSETKFGLTRSVYLPASATRPINKRSAVLKYAWDLSSSTHLLREFLSGGPPRDVTFDTTYVLQSYVYGDGSRNKFRFCLDEGSGTSWTDHEVSIWTTIDWVGWRLVEWDLSDPSTVGTWIGNGVLDGTRYRVDSFQLTLGDSAASGGILYFDNFRVAKKTTAPVNVAEQPENRPKSYSLEQNYPNPFNPATTIAFSVPKKGYVTLMIYNVMGEYVATLVDRTVSPGDHKVTFQGENLSSGVYYYRLIYDGGRLTRKMLLTK
ncbi:hypothetical protein BMS3Bbin03_01054 [bacterium BMS3Bbin03]|nr:hypothetical protein BMS3Bbin03_01054 [bacterium BMS3Bbin03]